MISRMDGADAWVDAHAEALFRYALTRLRRRQDAEDAVQETLLAALAARRGFRGDSSERTWLIGILRHKIVDRIRADVRAPVVGEDAEAMDWCGETGTWLHPPKAWQGDPQQLAQTAEFWERVRACFATLPDRQAQAFALRVMDGLSGDEACKLLGVSATNLGVMLHRARTRLRDCLERTWFAPGGEPSP